METGGACRLVRVCTSRPTETWEASGLRNELRCGAAADPQWYASNSGLVAFFLAVWSQTASCEGPPLGKLITVLVVEDEPLIRLAISDQLQDLGFKVFEAANSREAVEKLTANADIQAMFTDVDMPGGMDGLKLAAAVRDGWPPLKIIVTSGHRKVSLSDLPSDCRFFDKPYRAEAIASAVREMVDA